MLLAHDSSGTLRGILPLFRSAQAGRDRTLTMIGGGDACSDYVSILADPDHARDVGKHMGQHLGKTATDPIEGWDLIDIDGVVEGDDAMAAFALGLTESGVMLRAESRMHTWFVPRADSFADQLKRYGKTQRRQMRRAAEKITEDGPLQRIIARTEQDVERLLNAVIELHQKRWEAEGRAGSYADPEFRRFMLDAAKAFLNQDQLYLVCLQQEGKIVGGELNFLGQDKILYSFTSGYDLNASELGPGRILRVDAFLQMYEQQWRGIDYLRGDETYKHRLASVSRPIMRVRAFAPALLPKLRHAACCTGFEFKQWMRRKTGRSPIQICDLTAMGSMTSPSASSSH